MNSRQLSYFVAIVETGGVSNAARKLNIAQPSLSQHINNLEEELGTTLLIRSPKGMTTTTSGEILYYHALKILSRMKQAAIDVQEEATVPRGEVMINIPPVIGEHLAPLLFAEIEQKYPEIELLISEALSLDSTKFDETTKVDIAITSHEDSTKRMNFILLYREPLFLVQKRVAGAPELPAEIEFKDAVKHPLTISRKRHSIRNTILEACDELNLRPHFKIETEAYRLYRGYVRHGVCAAVWPWPTFYDMQRSNEVTAQKIINPNLDRSIYLAWSKDIPLTAAAKVVKDVIIKLVDQLREQGVIKGEIE